MPLAEPVLATVQPSGGVGLGIVIVAVGVLMAGGAAISLRSIWGRRRAPDQPLARQGPIPEPPRPLRSPRMGELRGMFRMLISFDFGCLALLSLVLIFLGLAVIFRSL
jgi:uncharacterized iron-regulated membrane protein